MFATMQKKRGVQNFKRRDTEEQSIHKNTKSPTQRYSDSENRNPKKKNQPATTITSNPPKIACARCCDRVEFVVVFVFFSCSVVCLLKCLNIERNIIQLIQNLHEDTTQKWKWKRHTDKTHKHTQKKTIQYRYIHIKTKENKTPVRRSSGRIGCIWCFYVRQFICGRAGFVYKRCNLFDLYFLAPRHF